MNTGVFDRIEKKHLITGRQQKRLLKTIRQHVKKDEFHKTEICNIYFDNNNYDLIIGSIDWVDFKAKIRARYYQGYDYVFLELKTKIRGDEENIGYKRRVQISLRDYKTFSRGQRTLVELLRQNHSDSRSLQIAKEIDYLVEKFNLVPKILVMYDRENYEDGEGLRITFDKNLRFRDKNLSFIPRKNDTIYFKDERNVIMEVKAHGAVPVWLVDAMTEQNIFPERFSKIGNIYQKIYQKGKNV